MSKPRLLDLFCGAGGAGMGYHRAGFEVVGVDNRPQKNYPFEFHQADALEYAREHGHEFDAIHASPPCQKYSMAQRIYQNSEKYPDLVDDTRELLDALGRPYVIENVPGAPLRVDLRLCGTMFGLRIIRHRHFESTVEMPLLVPACCHRDVYDPWHREGVDQRVQLALAMGIDWGMTRPEVREAIPPAYTEFIGEQLLDYLEATSDK